MRFDLSEALARRLDAQDPLKSLRKHFLIPEARPGEPCVYLAGHSLGLAPCKAQDYVREELRDWARLGVEGHFSARNPWVAYHELATAPMARLAGAKPIEVVVMNTLTVNLHLMLVSFYRPTRSRYKILIEAGAFPSDRYAVESQIRAHGLDPAQALIELAPRPGEETLRPADILETIAREGGRVAVLLLGSVQYRTGQAFDIPAITRAGHEKGCAVGFDLAHGAGNLVLKLHDWDVDFAVWCTYKYLNSGPGGLGAAFVHERHARDRSLPRLAGWWGHNKKTRFEMPRELDPLPGAEGWQLSNPPILPLASLRASLEIFDAATMPRLRRKSELLTRYLEFWLEQLPPDFCELITPKAPEERGCQLSLRVREDRRSLLARLDVQGVVCDIREGIVRVAPVPLYNRFQDVYRFAQALRSHALAR